MANSLFDKGREGILDRTIDMTASAIKVVLVRGYTPALTTHQFVSDVTTAGGTLVGTATALSSKTYTAGVFDAADVTFSSVATTTSTAYVLVFNDTGTASTSRVVALIDTATGLPVTPNGNDISLVFDNGTNRIFKL